MKITGIYIILICTLFTGLVNASGMPVFSDDPKISIYPNPVTNQEFVFKTDFDVQKVEIINIVGNTVYSNKYINPTNRAEVQLDHLEGGIYILRLETDDNKIVIKKFLVK